MTRWDPVTWLALLLAEHGTASAEAIYRAGERDGLSREQINLAALSLDVVERFPAHPHAHFPPWWSLPRVSDYRSQPEPERYPDLRFQPPAITRIQKPPYSEEAA